MKGKLLAIAAFSLLALPGTALAQAVNAEVGPCMEAELKQKAACLNVIVGNLQAKLTNMNAQFETLQKSFDALKANPGSFVLRQDRSGYCLTFLENEQGKQPILLTCDHPPNQNWTLIRP